MNLSGLNTKQATVAATVEGTPLAEGFIAPYFAAEVVEGKMTDTKVDVVSRMFYSKRAMSARPISDEVQAAVDPSVLNHFISATGQENNIARKRRFAVRIFFNFAKKDGSLITRDVPVSIVKASHIFDVVVAEDGSLTVEFITLEAYLVRHDFLKKGQLGRTKSTSIAIPLVADLNSIRLSLSGLNYVCKLATTGYIDSGLKDGKSFAVDLRVADTNIKVGDMEKAIDLVVNGNEEVKVRATAASFVRTAVLFALSMSENLRIFKQEQDGFLPRDMYRMFGAQVCEAYYGKAEYSQSEDNYRFHALLGGVFDLATLGGEWQNVPAGRVVAGDGWNITCMNSLNR